MTKSTITREQLIKKAQEQIEFCRHTKITGEGRAHVNQCAALFEIALAAMDSEPVAWTWHYREQWHVTNDKCRAEFVAKDGDVAVLPLYRHAQPVPVVSADLLHTAASAIEDLLEHTDPNTSYYSGVWADVPGKLRAAMFQAKSLTGNSPVIGIDLASGPDRTVEVRYVAPPGCVMVPKEPTKEMIDAGWLHYMSTKNPSSKGTYKAMLAAAPQEVNHG
ncbi:MULTISPECIES: hypothetical protein [Klebsiella]|uniref:hypothetical protein n=1 Tax=Klebsiella TaxID=570 RepID=UPI0015AAF927|nr:MULTISPECIES: hypothetical protein [Klebsiella]MEC5327614.1 hypothetical protein [Klebsiella oxytoca]MEC5357660.1 hypothetical protein [Klebsiella oxytoca]